VPTSDQEHLTEISDLNIRSLDILARALHVKSAELEPTLQAIVSTAVRMLSPARYAGLIIFSGGELIPQASTDRVPLLLDHLQQKLGDGPCVNAAQCQSIVQIDDTRQDGRWPDFAADAANLGVRSMLCVPLWVDQRCLGALSLYADQAAAFTDLHGRVTTLLATFAALALAEAQRADQLTAALVNRDVIGQAKGILMERHRITADAAFGFLTRVSQAENTKLAAIAAQLVATGELPIATSPDP
jgi:GAF domain-containing protein